MAKDRKKLVHIHSKIMDKQPRPEALEVGEIAVNNGVSGSTDRSFLSIKNADNKVVRFSSDEQMIFWTEKKEVIPFEGQVRGEDGPESTKDSGDYGSYGITNNDLLNNKSNLVIKFNQVAASNTPKSEKINGAEDIYHKLVNGTPDGSKQGAGIAIDMSRYAMRGANPSFSSLTITNGTTLEGDLNVSGNTKIGNGLNVTGATNISGATKITGDTTFNGNETVNGNLTVTGNTNISGDTRIKKTLTVDGATKINNNLTVTGDTNISGNTRIDKNLTVSGNTNVSGNTTIKGNTRIDKDLTVSGNTNVSGNTTIKGDTNISGDTRIDKNLTVSGNTFISGNTTIDKNLTVNGDTKLQKLSATTANVTNLYATNNISGSSLTATTISGGSAVIGGNLNVSGNTTIKGDTNISGNTRIDKNLTVSGNTNVSGDTNVGNNLKVTNGITADTVSATTSIKSPTISGTDITASNSVKADNVSANTITAATSVTTKDLDVSGNGKINNLSAGTLTVSGNTNLKGDVTIDGKTIFNGEVEFEEPIKFESACPQKITATTIGDAICEAFDRSVITIEKDTSPSDARLATVYTVKQNGQIVNTIEVAKDKVLKSAETVKVDNEWYIRLTWITFDPDTQTEVETTTEVSVASLVRDIDDKNPNGLTKETTYNNIVVDVWYENGQNWVSANTTSNIHASGNLIADGKLIVSGDTVLGGKLNVSGDTTLKKVTADTINVTSLTATSGNITSLTATTFSAGTISASTIVTPSGLSKKLTWELGTPSADTTGYNGSTDKTITIPGQFEHLENYDGTKFNLSHPVNITGNVTITGEITASGAIYSSDRDLKENIQFIGIDDINKVKNIPTRSFNFKDDESKRKTYGVIAQEVQDANLNELVHVKDDGKLGVDYTSLYALKIAYLENMCNELNGKIVELENKLNKLENKD